MTKYITAERLQEAIVRLAAYQTLVRGQGLQHIPAFLAIKRKGVNTATEIQFEEKDDFDFWDRFFLVDENDASGRYYDPFAGSRRISSHPHSNIATARKGTFDASWHAGERRVEDGNSYWRLNDGYLKILKEKCVSKGGETHRIPALDLVIWLRREDALPDDTTIDSLLAWFRTEFRLTPEEFETLFEGGEPAGAEDQETAAPVPAVGMFDNNG